MLAIHCNDTTLYHVITNYQKRYFIWPAEKDIPHGWEKIGQCGTRRECLRYILDVWKSLHRPTLHELFERARNQDQLLYN